MEAKKYVCPFCGTGWSDKFEFADHVAKCCAKHRDDKAKKEAEAEITMLADKIKSLQEKLDLRQKEYEKKYGKTGKEARKRSPETTAWTMVIESPLDYFLKNE